MTNSNKIISFQLSKQEYEKLLDQKRDKSISEYIRSRLFGSTEQAIENTLFEVIQGLKRLEIIADKANRNANDAKLIGALLASETPSTQELFKEAFPDLAKELI